MERVKVSTNSKKNLKRRRINKEIEDLLSKLIQINGKRFIKLADEGQRGSENHLWLAQTSYNGGLEQVQACDLMGMLEGMVICLSKIWGRDANEFNPMRFNNAEKGESPVFLPFDWVQGYV
ncbi:hypothetical protein HPP92_011819 [Vanilla planifolia]|uniref:Uncharacterized protein n=1 Tax=Vanilla planifolia TaxID=51239 RepID=A0A835R1D4_VANPL|nr:hypothetical protein HPP92_011819 [Vanilla planifolia]